MSRADGALAATPPVLGPRATAELLPLPDVSSSDAPAHPSALDWVGMQGVDLPLTIGEPGYRRSVGAKADVQVDLPAPDVKGIHMSRLYRLLDDLSGERIMTPSALRDVLAAMIDSHADCGSTSARLALSFEMLIQRPALVTPGLAGWVAYPVRLDARRIRGVFTLRLGVTVAYSSTCPCSAALSRQIVEDAFLSAFADQPVLKPSVVADWLRRNASLATPHSQRSEAEVSVSLDPDAADLGIMALIDRIEMALGTPVQAAVKRADEQAFARLNGENLMFVEDAARRLLQALQGGFHQPQIYVRHRESLHPHDAVAWSGDVPRD